MSVVTGTRHRAASAMALIRDTINPEAAETRNKAELLARLRASRRSDDVHWLMNSERGRRIVYQLLADCGHQGSTLGADGLPSAHAEGRRSVAIQMAGEIAAAHPENWIVMLRERMIDNLNA